MCRLLQSFITASLSIGEGSKVLLILSVTVASVSTVTVTVLDSRLRLDDGDTVLDGAMHVEHSILVDSASGLKLDDGNTLL